MSTNNKLIDTNSLLLIPYSDIAISDLEKYIVNRDISNELRDYIHYAVKYKLVEYVKMLKDMIEMIKPINNIYKVSINRFLYSSIDSFEESIDTIDSIVEKKYTSQQLKVIFDIMFKVYSKTIIVYTCNMSEVSTEIHNNIEQSTKYMIILFNILILKRQLFLHREKKARVMFEDFSFQQSNYKKNMLVEIMMEEYNIMSSLQEEEMALYSHTKLK